jgi:putative membrane protein
MKALTAMGKAVLAGLAGTAAMTAYQEAVSRARGRSAAAEQLKEPRTWAEAPAPAQLAKKVFNKRVVKRQAPLITNIVHWSYGAALGGAYGLAAARLQRNAAVQGVAFGTAVWGLAYASLTPLGIYEAPWRYPAKTLGIDFSYHLVYGLGVAAAFDALD